MEKFSGETPPSRQERKWVHSPRPTLKLQWIWRQRWSRTACDKWKKEDAHEFFKSHSIQLTDVTGERSIKFESDVSWSRNVLVTRTGAFQAWGRLLFLPFHARGNMAKTKFPRQDNRRICFIGKWGTYHSRFPKRVVVHRPSKFWAPATTNAISILPSSPTFHTPCSSLPSTPPVYLDLSLIFRLFLFKRLTRFLCHLARILWPETRVFSKV